jgi:predicted transcriptional regulator
MDAMHTDTKEKILAYIKKGNKVTSKDISEHLGISRQALYKHLPELLKEQRVKKIGTPPRVYFLGSSDFLMGKAVASRSGIIWRRGNSQTSGTLAPML